MYFEQLLIYYRTELFGFVQGLHFSAWFSVVFYQVLPQYLIFQFTSLP